MDVRAFDAFIRRLHRHAYATLHAQVCRALAAGLDAAEVREAIEGGVKAGAGGGGPHFDETAVGVMRRALDDALAGREPSPPFPET